MHEMRSGSVYMDYIGSRSVMEEISFRSSSSAFLDVARTRYCLGAGRLLLWKDWINGGLKVDISTLEEEGLSIVLLFKCPHHSRRKNTIPNQVGIKY